MKKRYAKEHGSILKADSKTIFLFLLEWGGKEFFMKKNIVALGTTALMTLAMAVPAFAADNAKLYAYDADTDSYISSAHADMCLDSVTDTGRGTYSLVFEVIEYSGVTGYISKFAGQDVVYVSENMEEGTLSEPIYINATKDLDMDGDGEMDAIDVSFTVNIGEFMTHPYDEAALVVEE